MNIRNATIACFIPAFLFLAGDVEAVGLRNMTFEQQVAEADAVVVATTWRGRGGRPRLDPTGQMELTRMRVLRVLKGNSNLRALDLVTQGSTVEFNPQCCEPEKLYILVLRQGRDNMYEVLNGRHSAIVILR
jgi:hypothetical protein